MKNIRWIIVYLNFWRVFPAYIIFRLNKFRDKCSMDLMEWVKHDAKLSNRYRIWQLGYCLVHCKECRNIFHNRLHRNTAMYVLMRLMFGPLENCYINMPPEKIGGGFSFQHGFSTIVTAKEIGERCRIYQQVTIGFGDADAPVLGNDVVVTAGAIVIGNVHIGDNAVVGAGAVVVHDVPTNAVVAGVPAKVIKIHE